VNPTTGQPTNIEFMRAREMSDGRLMVLTRQRTNVDFGGNLTIIDANRFVEKHADHARGHRHARSRADARHAEVREHDPGPSKGGRFESGFPLWDGSGRILVCWSQ
jgi:hypothetical protein